MFYFCVLLQQNHEALMSLYKDMETGAYVPNSVSSSWKDHKKEEKQLIDNLLAHFSKNSQSYPKTKARYMANITSSFYLTFHLQHRQIIKILFKAKET